MSKKELARTIAALVRSGNKVAAGKLLDELAHGGRRNGRRLKPTMADDAPECDRRREGTQRPLAD